MTKPAGILAARKRFEKKRSARAAFYGRNPTASERRQARNRGESPKVQGSVRSSKPSSGGAKAGAPGPSSRADFYKSQETPKSSGGSAAPEALAAAAYKAGFRGEALKKAVRVALAESGGRPKAVGDTTLANSKWGPSVGAWQVRTLRGETGTGKSRDINALMGDLERQAQAAFEISGGGKTWQPWTVHQTGADKEFQSAAERAASFWNR